MKKRTTVSFDCPHNLWPQVESWAAQTGFVLKDTGNNRRLYRKGSRLLMAPIMVELRQEGENATLEAWVAADMFLILSVLTGSKPEAAIESGGLTAMLPRRRARTAVNVLLRSFKQKPIT